MKHSSFHLTRIPILPEEESAAAEAEKITNANCFENTTRHRMREEVEGPRGREGREKEAAKKMGKTIGSESGDEICRHLSLFLSLSSLVVKQGVLWI